MILPAAADVAIIRHIARAVGAPMHGVTLATIGHTCAGNATDRGMNSKIAASSSQDTEVLVAMVDLSDDTAIVPIFSVMRTATEHSLDQDNALLQSMQAIRLLAGAVNSPNSDDRREACWGSYLCSIVINLVHQDFPSSGSAEGA